MPPTRARRRALRAVLGALAGGGLTAASLASPVATNEAFASNIGGVPTTPEVTAPELPSETSSPATATENTTTTPAPATPTHRDDDDPQAGAPAQTGSAAHRLPAAPAESDRRLEDEVGQRQRHRQGEGRRAQRRRRLAAGGRQGGRARRRARLLAGLDAGALLLPRPAVPAADLQGRRRAVRRAVADPRRDQRNRDRLRHRPVRLDRRRGRLDAVHARHLEHLRRRRAGSRLRRPLQPGRRDLRRRALPARRRRGHRPARARSSPTTTPKNTSTR